MNNNWPMLLTLSSLKRHLPPRLRTWMSEGSGGLLGLLGLVGAPGVLGLATLMSGCAWVAPPKVDMAPAPVLKAVAAPPDPAAQNPAPGAIYRAASYRPLFEEHRARAPGDTLVVQIAERVSAAQRSTSSLDRSGNLSGSISALPLVNPRALARASVQGQTETGFNGRGAVESSNDFTGVVTVVVRQVLPNGHLLVDGERQIGLHEHVDVLRFSGQVDPRAIAPGNTVLSTHIANVRLQQRGRGAQAEAQAMGWMGRVFLSVAPL